MNEERQICQVCQVLIKNDIVGIDLCIYPNNIAGERIGSFLRTN